MVNASELSNPAGNYVVQLNAFSIESNANNSIKKWKSRGYPVFLNHEDGERWFKVRIGPYANWEEAREVSLKLKEEEELSPLVLLTLKGKQKPVELAEPRQLKEVPGPKSEEILESSSTETDNSDDDFEIDAVDRVVARFMEWKKAWQAKDLSAYLQFYSSSFDSGAKSFQAWERLRAKALSRKGRILIDVAEVQILPDGQEVEMRFIQKFKSSRFSDVGHKTIVWRLENGDWHIVSERWLPI